MRRTKLNCDQLSVVTHRLKTLTLTLHFCRLKILATSFASTLAPSLAFSLSASDYAQRLAQTIAQAHHASQMVAHFSIGIGELSLRTSAAPRHAIDLLNNDVVERLNNFKEQGYVGLVQQIEPGLFDISFPSIGEPAEVIALGQALAKTLQEAFSCDDRIYYLQPSIGAALAPWDATDALELMDCSRLALQHAASQGKSLILFSQSVQSVQNSLTRLTQTNPADYGQIFRLDSQIIMGTRTALPEALDLRFFWQENLLSGTEAGVPIARDFFDNNQFATHTTLWLLQQLKNQPTQKWPIRVGFSLRQLESRVSQHALLDTLNTIPNCVQNIQLALPIELLLNRPHEWPKTFARLQRARFKIYLTVSDIQVPAPFVLQQLGVSRLLISPKIIQAPHSALGQLIQSYNAMGIRVGLSDSCPLNSSQLSGLGFDEYIVDTAITPIRSSTTTAKALGSVH